jgi:hypothetical protein
VQLAVEQDLTATIATLTYVTPWKIFGGTYAFGVAPSMLAADVNVGIGLPAFTGPRGRTFGPFNFETGDTNLAPGDLGIIPLLLGWNAGNVHWNFALFGLAPTGDYSIRQLANMSLSEPCVDVRKWTPIGHQTAQRECRRSATNGHRG